MSIFVCVFVCDCILGIAYHQRLSLVVPSSGAGVVAKWLAIVLVLTAATVRTHFRNQDWLSEESIYESGIIVCE